jgi:hypothetical protein
VRNILARNDHAPITDELSSIIKQQLYQRTAVSKAGGRVLTRGRQNNANLASKIVKNWSMAKPFRAYDMSGRLSPSGTSLECFPTNKQRKN